MIPALEIFRTRRVQTVIDELQDRRNRPGDLWFLERTPITPAMDSEVTGRWLARGEMTDLIAPDAEARIYTFGQVSRFTTTPVKHKIGIGLNETQIQDILSFAGSGTEVPKFVLDTRAKMSNALLNGHDERLEQLIIACYLDTFHYNKLGFKLDIAGWGMPADLKLVPADPWDDATNGDGISDISALQEIAAEKYGTEFNQLVCSTEAFRKLIRQAKFQKLAALFLPQTITFQNLNLVPAKRQVELASQVLNGMDIKLYDGRSFSQNSQGLPIGERRLPINYAILRNKAMDNNPDFIDFANCWITEAMLAAGIEANGTENWQGFGDARYGPYVYTRIPSNLDPPSIQAYVVGRGWPRKNNRFCNAYIKVADALTDSIGVTDIVL